MNGRRKSTSAHIYTHAKMSLIFGNGENIWETNHYHDQIIASTATKLFGNTHGFAMKANVFISSISACDRLLFILSTFLSYSTHIIFVGIPLSATWLHQVE